MRKVHEEKNKIAKGTQMAIETLLHEQRVFHPSEGFKSQAHISNSTPYTEAQQNRLDFWKNQALQLTWSRPFETILEWNRPYAAWFKEGQLNASTNCLDVHLKDKAQKIALIWESELGHTQQLTYQELHHQVCRLAYELQHQFNVVKGDRVTLYMPLIPELAIGVLACARIGAIHSVVFGGFSATSLKDRIQDSQSKVLLTADGGYRRGKVIPLKEVVDQALAEKDTPIEHVLVVRHIGDPLPCPMVQNRDHDYASVLKNGTEEAAPESMNSEDPLFILYTSGTTGKPKGIVHSTGGYLTHAKYSTKAVFDLKDSDIYWCTADIGWITGHTYVIYGPLSNGATVFMYEGSPDYPDYDRFWKMIAAHKISILYTAPTAIRSFMKWGEHHPKAHDLSSLRLLGTVGEPINPEAWMWYQEHIGLNNCPIVDTWWQTETGGIMITTLPGLHPTKPGKAGVPLPGIEAKILDEDGSDLKIGGGLLSLTEPWPSMLRGIWGDPQRFEEVYWGKFPTYFAGDGAMVDEDGYFMILGRVDDVLNVAGHRIGTMEVESALVGDQRVAEAAVVGMPDALKGQAIVGFVILKEGVLPSPKLEKALIQVVGESIGAIAKPKQLIFTPELPKTRSGKIMRRLLKNLVEGKEIGDCTTLANPGIMDELAKSLKI